LYIVIFFFFALLDILDSKVLLYGKLLTRSSPPTCSTSCSFSSSGSFIFVWLLITRVFMEVVKEHKENYMVCALWDCNRENFYLWHLLLWIRFDCRQRYSSETGKQTWFIAVCSYCQKKWQYSTFLLFSIKYFLVICYIEISDYSSY
jgi:hypothetical protein